MSASWQNGFCEVNLIDENRPINDQEAVGEEAATLLFDYTDVEFIGFGEDQQDDHDVP